MRDRHIVTTDDAKVPARPDKIDEVAVPDILARRLHFHAVGFPDAAHLRVRSSDADGAHADASEEGTERRRRIASRVDACEENRHASTEPGFRSRCTEGRESLRADILAMREPEVERDDPPALAMQGERRACLIDGIDRRSRSYRLQDRPVEPRCGIRTGGERKQPG